MTLTMLGILKSSLSARQKKTATCSVSVLWEIHPMDFHPSHGFPCAKEPGNPEPGVVTLQEWFHKIRAVKSCPASECGSPDVDTTEPSITPEPFSGQLGGNTTNSRWKVWVISDILTSQRVGKGFALTCQSVWMFSLFFSS